MTLKILITDINEDKYNLQDKNNRLIKYIKKMWNTITFSSYFI